MVLLEKLIVAQVVKRFLSFYGTRRFIIEFTKASHWNLFRAS
jgi:prolipoprotein diacylglyceryltransferase